MREFDRTRRIVLGVLVAAYTLISGVGGFLNVLLVRLGRTPLYAPPWLDGLLRVLAEIPRWEFALWPLVIACYLVVVWLLVSGRKALQIYGLALCCDPALLALFRLVGAAGVDRKAVNLDYAAVAIAVALGVAVWASERERAAVNC